MSIDLRPRTATALGCIAVIGTLLIPQTYASQFSLRLIEFVAPVQAQIARGGRALADNAESLFSFRSIARRNRALESHVAELQEELQAERARSAEKDRRLRAFAELAPYRAGLQTREAEVIGQGAGPQRGILFIHRGTSDGLREGTVVVAGRSIAGTVRVAAPAVSSVLLVTSPGSRLDAQIVSTGERGIVVGNGDGTMQMKYVSRTAPHPGDGVVTAGRDGVTPKHLLVGLVASVRRAPGSLTYEVVLRPVRELDRLDNVIAVWPPVRAADFPKGSE